MAKAAFKILVLALAIVIAASSIGFYFIGFDMGSNAGYAKGYNIGSSSILVSTFTEVKLDPNATFYVAAPAAKTSTVVISYGLAAIPAVQGEANATISIEMVGGGQLIFNSGFGPTEYGAANISNATGYQFISIFIRANPGNSAPVTLEFTSPLEIESVAM